MTNSDNFPPYFGENLDRLLKMHGLTHQDLADVLGDKVSRSAISKWISNTSTPTLGNVYMVSKHFGVEMSDMFKDHGVEDYYIEEEIRNIADGISKNKELKLLFEAARDVNSADLVSISEVLKALKKKEIGDDV